LRHSWPKNTACRTAKLRRKANGKTGVVIWIRRGFPRYRNDLDIKPPRQRACLLRPETRSEAGSLLLSAWRPCGARERNLGADSLCRRARFSSEEQVANCKFAGADMTFDGLTPALTPPPESAPAVATGGRRAAHRLQPLPRRWQETHGRRDAEPNASPDSQEAR
jgi:hypothetical protein